MFLQYLQFGLLFSGVLFVAKALGQIATWTWVDCFVTVPVAGGFCVIFAIVDVALDVIQRRLAARRRW